MSYSNITMLYTSSSYKLSDIMIQHKLALTKLSKIAYCMEGCDVPWDIITLSIWHILCYLLPYYFLTYILQNITCCITISCYVDWLYSMLWTQWSDGTIDDDFWPPAAYPCGQWCSCSWNFMLNGIHSSHDVGQTVSVGQTSAWHHHCYWNLRLLQQPC